MIELHTQVLQDLKSHDHTQKKFKTLLGRNPTNSISRFVVTNLKLRIHSICWTTRH